MKVRLLPAVVALFLPAFVFAGGYHASFVGVQDVCRNHVLTDTTTVIELCLGIVDASNNPIDTSGANLFIDRAEFETWTQGGTCAVTVNQYRNPVDGTKDADLLDNTGDVNGYRTQQVTGLGSVAGRTFNFSVWVRADIPHDVTLTISDDTSPKDQDFAADGLWRRIDVTQTFTSAATWVNGFAYPGEKGTAPGKAYFYGAKLTEIDEWRPDRGVYLDPPAQNVAKPAHDLTNTNNPTFAKADYQGIDGNRLTARVYNGTDQLDGTAPDSSMDIYEDNHTVTAVVYHETTATDMFFSNGAWSLGGLYGHYSGNTGVWTAVYGAPGGAEVSVTHTLAVDDMWAIVQIVRKNDFAKVCVNGSCGADTDVSGTGLDVNEWLYVSGLAYWDGMISYVRIDAKAQPDSRLAYEREVLTATVSNQQHNALSVTRSTTATIEFEDGSLSTVPVNVARVGGRGGGLEAEGQATQLHGLTEAFDSWINSGGCAVTANDHVAPDGTLTADLLDNTGGVNSDRRSITTADLGNLTGRAFNLSTFIRADTSHLCSFGAYENGVGWIIDPTNVASVTPEWQRFNKGGTCAGGGTGTITVYFYPGQNAVATGAAHFWGANLKELPFMDSYVPNAGAATSQVTRTFESVALDPHPAGKSSGIVLAEKYESTGQANKITVYAEFNARWSGAADIGDARNLINIGDTSSANNDLQLIVDSNGKVNLKLTDDGGTSRWIIGSAHTFYSDWFSVRAVVDFADLSRSELYVNEAVDHSADNNMTGTAIFDTSGNMIRIGANRIGSVDGYHRTGELRIDSKEVRP